MREVGAKAAELAALAGEKAGPVAQNAAELTGQAGKKLAVKRRDLADRAAPRRRRAKVERRDRRADIADGDGAPSRRTADEQTTTGVA